MENHLNINSQFIPYELALKLKELGFDELCAYAWCQQTKGYPKEKLIEEYRLKTDGNPFGSFNEGKNWNKSIDGRNKNNIRCSAPLWQQAESFLRTKILFHTIFREDGWYWEVLHKEHFSKNGNFKTYEEARQACLEKLIQILEDENT